ncbi:hypothetical protein B0H13DRAFT_1526697, partial [Mycena leptocephala]
LSAHDDKISQLRAQLERLEQEHTSLATDLSRNTAILSPMRRMPPEILSEIFMLTLPSDRAVLEHGRINMRDSPWVLTHICGRWRIVALASSSLWSFIGIDCTIRRDLSAAFPLRLLAVQPQRATHLRVNFTPGGIHSMYEMSVIQLLVEHSPRWEDAYL